MSDFSGGCLFFDTMSHSVYKDVSISQEMHNQYRIGVKAQTGPWRNVVMKNLAAVDRTTDKEQNITRNQPTV